MISTLQMATLLLIATLGHAMAVFWYFADMSRLAFKAISDAMLHGGNEFVGDVVESAQDDYLGSISWAAAHAFLKLPKWVSHPGRATMMNAVNRLRAAARELVVQEAMRLYPPAPAIVRVAREEATLEGERVAAGTLIIISIYALHRNTKRWSDPDRFDPTRFAPGNEREIARYQYMPFGAGPRICIGAALAIIEATAMLATIIRAARFETVPGHVPVPDWRVALRATGGMPLRVFMRAI